jgi:hypothetical protein
MTARVDASGVALELAHPPRRIVSLISSTTETLCRLGLSDALVGVTAYCVEPREVVRTKTKVGGEKSPDLEANPRARARSRLANVEEKKRGRRTNVDSNDDLLKAWQQRDDRGGDGPSRCAMISGAQSRSKTRQVERWRRGRGRRCSARRGGAHQTGGDTTLTPTPSAAR